MSDIDLGHCIHGNLINELTWCPLCRAAGDVRKMAREQIFDAIRHVIANPGNATEVAGHYAEVFSRIKAQLTAVTKERDDAWKLLDESLDRGTEDHKREMNLCDAIAKLLKEREAMAEVIKLARAFAMSPSGSDDEEAGLQTALVNAYREYERAKGE